ncbi:PQQ-binding-like beta-propeller repeat protein [Paraferrimonas sp. SM1919]|uniref:outer membrane protein assembly factor BamB family protein n=1 Tax=Paraferrimonas sp. SM1919 TaxID=2662263 RepID=UPI0013D36934|nr:PQQ-binding-like beta-propeller repeat protein [Paraferrimonas sp. SM1919]
MKNITLGITMGKFIKFLLFILIVSGISAYVFLKDPVLRNIPTDKGSHWQPNGIPNVPNSTAQNLNKVAFRTMHGDLNNSDQLWIATAPEQELAWTAEAHLYVPEGPTMDDNGNIYFSPLFPSEDVSLIALDGDTGKRIWSLPTKGDIRGAGAPLVLNTPEYPHKQTIYHATFHWAWAVAPDGTILWHKPTGFNTDRDIAPHHWGVNYVAQFDALTLVTGDGQITLLNRANGEPLLDSPISLPGTQGPKSAKGLPKPFIIDRGNQAAAKVFGKPPEGDGFFTFLLNVIFGAGSEVANFYAVDSNTGRMFVAATAPDETDGKLDGISSNGAVYALDIINNDKLELVISARYDFSGGTGSTPTVSNDGQRLYLSDDNGHVIVLDRDLNELWRKNVGEQIAASIAVSADNNELYAVTKHNIFKLFDKGDKGEMAWTATLDAYSSHDNINSLTPTITANGIAVGIGAKRSIGNSDLMIANGFGLLDKDTGKLRGYSRSVEESISVTSVAPDGGYVIAHSPVRRLASAGLFPSFISPIMGGIARFKPSNYGLLAREAACSASKIQLRMEQNQANPNYQQQHRQWDQQQLQALITQTEMAMAKAQLSFDTDDLTGLCSNLTD